MARTTGTPQTFARAEECCCTGTGTHIFPDCCPSGVPVPEILYGTLVNATGDCSTYTPTSWTFVYDPVNSTPTSHLWHASGPSLGNNESPSNVGGITDYTLSCQGAAWNLIGYAVLLDCQIGNPTSDCDPLLLTFNYVGSGDPSCNNDDFLGQLCSGTYQVIVTE